MRSMFEDIIVFVIVHPNIPERREAVETELRRVRIDTFYCVDGTMSPSNSVGSRDACIINSHLSCFSKYVSLRTRKHLLILEDDVKFLTTDPLADIRSALNSIRSTRWYTLHVGHFPLGPLIPINLSVAWTVFPFTAHAILWNCECVRSVLSKARHGRPYVIEGNLHLPLFSRFAMLKPIATQSRRPKELTYLDTHPVLGVLTRQFNFKTWNDAFIGLSVVSPVVLTVLILAAFWKTTLAYIGAVPFLILLFALTEKKILMYTNNDDP